MIVNKNLLIYGAIDIILIINLILLPSLFFITYALAQSSADCPPGFGLDPDPGGGCVPLPPNQQQPDPRQSSVECPKDQVLDPDGYCVPQQGSATLGGSVECPKDQVLDPDGYCVPQQGSATLGGSVECPKDQVLDPDGYCIPSSPGQTQTDTGAAIFEEGKKTGQGIFEEGKKTGQGIFEEGKKTGQGIGGKLGEIKKTLVSDNTTLGLEIGLLPLAVIIGAIGAGLIGVYKVKHRNRESKSYPSSINVDVITRGGIEE